MNKIVYRIRRWISQRNLYKAYDRAVELEIKALMKYYHEDISTSSCEMFPIIDDYLNNDEKKEYYDLQVSFGHIESHNL
jgi:hypothetical protein